MQSNNIKINADRLWGTLMEMAKIGATRKGGVCRLTMTDLDQEGRELLKPDVGLALARMIGHITYLSREAMTEKFEADRLDPRDVEGRASYIFMIIHFLFQHAFNCYHKRM